MNTYTLTEIELTELLRKQRELCANELPPKWKEALSPMILNAPLPPLPSGAKKEDIQPVLADEKSLGEAWNNEDDEKWEKLSQKQSLIDIMEADQRDGIYGVSDNATSGDNCVQEHYEPAIMQSAFHFKNGIRMICYTSYENGIKSFECNEDWQPWSKPFASCPFAWCGHKTMTEYHRKIRAQHDLEDFVPEHSTVIPLPIEPNPDPQNTTKEPVIEQADIEQIIEQHCNQSSREAHYNAAEQIYKLINNKVSIIDAKP